MFPDQADRESTSLPGEPPAQRSVLSEMTGSAQKGNTQKDHEMHENNLKLDVANQLLELHKVMQHRSSPSTTPGSGSETMSESGDEVNQTLKRSPSASPAIPARPQAAASVSPGLTYQDVPNMQLPNMSHMEQTSVTPQKMTSKGAEFHVPQSVQVRYCRSPQPNPQGMDYLRLPFQSTSYAGNKQSISTPERIGHVSVSLPERQKSPTLDQSVNAMHSAVNSAPQRKPHFAVNVDPRSQRRNHSNFIENSPGAENALMGSAMVPKTAKSTNIVPCHRVSVIQYHSSAQNPSNDGRNEESLIKGTVLSESAFKTVESKPSADQLNNHEVPQNYRLMRNMEYLVRGIPQERIPYVPLTAENSITLRSWNKEIDEHVGKYSWALKEAKKTCEQLKMRDQVMQFSPTAIHSLESNQRNIFSQANEQPSTSLHSVLMSQERSVDMLKYLAREQIKLKDASPRETRSPSVEDDSETSEASESGDVPSGGKMFGNTGKQSPSSDSLGKNEICSPRASPP